MGSVVTVSEDWHLEMLLNLYIAKCSMNKAFSGCRAVLWFLCTHAEGSWRRCSVRAPRVPATAGQWLCSRKGLVKTKGSPEPSCIPPTNIFTWLLLWWPAVGRTFVQRSAFLFRTICGCRVNFTGIYRVVVCYGLYAPQGAYLWPSLL